MQRSLLLPSFLLTAAFFAACGGSPPPPSSEPKATPPVASAATPPPADTAAPPPASTAAATAPSTWSADMPKNQQIEYMKQVVMPKMKPVFAEHDAARYGDFSCKTCHGPKFLPPKEFLPHLTFKDGKITSFADKPEISKWMMEKVSPEMATALGQPHFDPKTKKGFGCGGCHTVDMK